MLEQGPIAGSVVMRPVEISGQWEALASTAGSLASAASSAAEDMESAASSWTGLVSSYRETETQAIVESALDEVPQVTREWAVIAGRAADVLQGFATEARGLELQAFGLEAQAAKLEALWWASGLSSGEGDSAEDDALENAIQAHNSEVMGLNSRWQQLEQQTAADIDAINAGGGLEDEVPVVNAGGGAFGPGAGSFGSTGLGAAGFGVAGLGAGGFGLGAGAGLGAGFQAAVAQMIRRGAATEDPVEEAQDLFDQAISEGSSGEDVQNFRDQIAEMDASEIEEFSEQTPAVHENSIPQPRSEEEYEAWPSGEDGNQWWNSLGEAGQAAVMTHLPLLVGNVQGVPNNKRDTANRDALKKLKNNPDYDDWDDNIQDIERSLTRSPGSEGPMLLSLDIGQRAEAQFPNAPGNTEPHGWEQQPLAAVSVGNPDTADTTTFGASGMGSGTHEMQDEVAISERLHRDLDRADDGSHAVVSWVGYDPPPGPMDSGDTASVWRNDRASAGGWDFAYALDGFQETRVAEGDEPSDFTVNVHAHSYGTNMAAHALTRVDHGVDAFAMYGSSGIPESVADHASELEVADDADGKPMVFASESSQDGTAELGRPFFLSRQDPTAEGFGAQEHYSGHPHDGDATELVDVTGHSREADDGDPNSSGYLDPVTAHYRNLTYILGGNHDRILTTEEYTEDWTPMSDVLRQQYLNSSGSSR